MKFQLYVGNVQLNVKSREQQSRAAGSNDFVVLRTRDIIMMESRISHAKGSLAVAIRACFFGIEKRPCAPLASVPHQYSAFICAVK